jgi:predicted nucleic acid-binding protein
MPPAWFGAITAGRTDTSYLLAREGRAGVEAQFLTSLADRTLWPVELTADDYRRAAEIVLTYEDSPLGTTDGTVIALCERLGLPEVATLDGRHFTVARPRHSEALTLLP